MENGMGELEDELQSLYMQLKNIEDKMNANYKDKYKKLRWYKEYLITKQRINAIKERLHEIELLIKKLDENPKLMLINEDGEEEVKEKSARGFWDRFFFRLGL